MPVWLIIAATISTFILGFLWYGPFMFKSAWCRENGIAEDARPGRTAVLAVRRG